MRDILTVLAGLLILVLVAALVGPAFVDWTAHRAFVEEALTRAAGAPVHTRGAIAVRLLPSPLVTLDGVELAAGGRTSLRADKVAVELALAPLLRGDLRIVDATLTRPVLRSEIGETGAMPLPRLDAEGPGGRVTVDRLTIRDGAVVALDRATQQERGLARLNAVLQGASLRGPWQASGTVDGRPFRISTGEADASGAVRLKAGLGNDLTGRWDAEGVLALAGAPGGSPARAATARFEGRLGYVRVLGAAANGEATVLTAGAAVTASEREVRAEKLDVEAGSGGRGLRLSGTASLDWGRDPRIELALATRRITVEEMEGLFGGDLPSLIPEFGISGLPVSVRISVGSIGWREEEASDVELALMAGEGKLMVERATARLPGDADLTFRGRLDPAGRAGEEASASGRLTLAVGAPRRLALSLQRLGVGTDVTDPLARQQKVSFQGDIFLSPTLSAASNLRLAAGGASLTGLARFAQEEGQAPSRLDAQLSLDNFDLADLPGLGSAGALLRGSDVTLVVDGKRIRYGEGADGGRVRAKLSRTGSAFAIETLDITGLAGLRLAASGRIEGATAGRIEARVEAPRAAPALALLRKMLPATLPGATLAISLVDGLPERLRGEPLRGKLVAQAAGGERGGTIAFDMDAALGDTRLAGTLTLGSAAQVETAALTLASPDSGSVLGRFGVLPAGGGVAPGPLQLAVTIARPDAEGHVLSVDGAVAGVQVKTSQPFRLDGAGREPVRLTLASQDASALARAFGLSPLASARMPLALDLTASPDERAEGAWRVAFAGAFAAQPVQGALTLSPEREVQRVELALDELSLPRLAALVALGPVPAAAPGTLWPSGRFSAPRLPLSGIDLDLSVKRLDLGSGFGAAQAGLTVRPVLDGVALTLKPSAFASGTLAGTLTLKRFGTAAALAADLALDQVDVAALGAGGSLEGRLSGILHVGGSGESPASIVANLAGGGSLKAVSFAVPRMDPAALARITEAAREDTDALDAGRLRTLLADAFATGALRAGVLDIPVTIAGGVLRAAPLVVATPDARVQGSLGLDLRTLGLDASALVTAATVPPGWTGAPPQIAVNVRGALQNPRREIDATSLATGLATLRLARELERIEAFEAQAKRLRAERDRKAEADRLRPAVETSPEPSPALPQPALPPSQSLPAPPLPAPAR